jgi:hypothetical protein
MIGTPQWQDPHKPLPKSKTEPPQSIVDQAVAVVGRRRAAEEPTMLAAVIIAQALDRLGDRMIEAAAVGKHHGS